MHLGAAHSVLHTDARHALLDAVAKVDRLVLLGDVLELRQRPLPQVLAAASGSLQGIGTALAPGASIVLVAGNHDHGLVAPALTMRDAPPRPDEVLVPGGQGPLERVVGWLGADRTEVRYPGVWLRDDVWATHGHYVDRHNTVPMLERLGAGLMARIVQEPPSGPRGVPDYEAALAPLYGWLDALAASAEQRAGSGGGASVRMWRALAAPGPRTVRQRALGRAFPLLIAGLNRMGVGPLSAELTRGQLRTGALRAMGEVLDRLELAPAHVVFGHTHRAGPLAGEEAAEWCTPSGAALVNCGCWVREGVLGGPDPARSPYRAGFAVWIDDAVGSAPRLVNLLD